MTKLLLIFLAMFQYTPAGPVFQTSGGGGGGPTVVQSQPTNNSSTVTYSTPITVGNILVLGFYAGANTDTLTATDTLGNTFVTLSPTPFGLGTDADGLAIVCAPITTGGSDTVQFKVNGSGTNAWSVAYEVHTTHGTCTTDVASAHSNTLASTSCNSGAMTTTTANDFLVSVCGLDGTNTSTITAGSGWSGGLNANLTGPTRPIVMSQYQVGTTPGSYTATSGTIPSEEQATVLVAIKP